MAIYFNATNTPTPVQRRLALAARILAAIATAKEPITSYGIRKEIEADHDFVWANLAFIWDILTKLVNSKRLVRILRKGYAVPGYAFPEEPFVPDDEARRANDCRIIESLDWPRFFHVPSKEDLLPHTKTRTGYDIRADHVNV